MRLSSSWTTCAAFRVTLLRCLSLVCTLLPALPGFASTWTLDQALRAAQATHPLIHSRRAGQDAARAAREGAEWQRYPTPSIEASQHSSGATGVLLRLDQPVWTGGRISSEIEAASWREQASQAATGEAREEVALKVLTAVVEAARQQLRARHAANSVAEHERLLDMIQRRVRQEVSPFADLRLAESRLFASRNELSSIEQQQRAALTQLAQLVGKPVTAVDGDSVETATTGLPQSLEQALQEALSHASTLRRLEAETEAASAEIKAKRAVLLPQLYVRLESQQGSLSDNRALLILQAQPGAGLSALSGVKAAVARREALRAQRQAAERDLAERVSLAWHEALAARDRVANADQVRATAAEVAESYARQYAVGRKTWLDVLNAVREATLTELALVDARAQAWGAALRLKLWTGRLALKEEGGRDTPAGAD